MIIGPFCTQTSNILLGGRRYHSYLVIILKEKSRKLEPPAAQTGLILQGDRKQWLLNKR